MHLIVTSTFTPSPVLFAGHKMPRLEPMRYTRSARFLAVSLLLLPATAAAGSTGQTSELRTELPSSPQALVQEVVQNALRHARNDQIHWSFRELVRKDGWAETREVCQTDAGTIDRLVAIDG